MADTATRKTGPAGNGKTPAGLPMFTLNEDLFSTASQAGQEMLASAISFNEEVARFANERLKANVERFEGLSKCGSIEDALTMQNVFARKMIEDYTQEMSKLAETATRGYMDAWKHSIESINAAPQAPFGD